MKNKKSKEPTNIEKMFQQEANMYLNKSPEDIERELKDRVILTAVKYIAGIDPITDGSKSMGNDIPGVGHTTFKLEFKESYSAQKQLEEEIENYLWNKLPDSIEVKYESIDDFIEKYKEHLTEEQIKLLKDGRE